MSAKKITILIPAYNEEENLASLLEELYKVTCLTGDYQWDFLFVNDGSRDNTLAILQEYRSKDSRINILDLSRNYGKEIAMMAGFDFVDADAIVIIDADLQDPPQLICDMIKLWEEGADDVYARRLSRGKESWLRKKLSLLFYSILQKSTRFDILENVGDFRLLDRRCVNALRTMRETQRYTKGMFCWIGFNKKEILFDRQDRHSGSSNWNFLSLLDLAIEGITSFTTTPLRIASVMGVLVSILSAFYAIWILTKTLIWGDPVAGYPTMMVVILFLGGVQLLSLGIIGEYLGRVFNEVKRRPGYFINTFNGDKCNDHTEIKR